MEQDLIKRSGGKCELSGSTEKLTVYHVPPKDIEDIARFIYISEKCADQLDGKEALVPSFWSFLKDSMWSEVSGVKVISWRMLNKLKSETWAMEALDMMYLPDDLVEWAQATGDHIELRDEDMHKDSNGTILKNGDSVVLTKSLDVKGSSLNARMGTAVRNIKLVADNLEQIEGKIDGQQIVILTKFVRKSG